MRLHLPVRVRGVAGGGGGGVSGMSEPIENRCEVCKAKPGEPCVNTIRPGEPLPGRDFHAGRAER